MEERKILSSHPSQADLEAFADGQCTPGSFVELETHISTCDVCAAFLSSVVIKDGLLGQLREALLPSAGDGEGPYRPATSSPSTSVAGDHLVPPPTADEIQCDTSTTLQFSSADEESSNSVVDGPTNQVRSASAAFLNALLPNGTQLGRYRIERLLGYGGMAVVYLATDSRLRRQVALKIPRFDACDADQLIGRFEREARAMALVTHRNLCPIHDVDFVDGHHLMAMAFIDGEPLSTKLARGERFPDDQIALIVMKLALALEKAHAAHVVHRDLKPANIMIDGEGEPILMDFGLARSINDLAPSVTQSGMIVGTPLYMAPELVAEDADLIGPWSDQYSLGAVLYELLAGQTIHRGNTSRVLAQLASGQPPLKPSGVRAGVAPALEQICLKAVSQRIEDRYPNLQEMANDLRIYLTGSHVLSAGLSSPSTRSSPHPPPPQATDGVTDVATGRRVNPASMESRFPARRRTVSILIAVIFGIAFAAFAMIRTGKQNSTPLAKNAVSPAVNDDQAHSKQHLSTKDGFKLALSLMDSGYANVPSLRLNPLGPHTLEAYVIPMHIDPARNQHVLGIPSQSSIFVNNQNQSQWCFSLYRVQPEYRFLATPDQAAIRVRVHLAAVFTGTQMRWFRDGKRVGTRDDAQSPLQESRGDFSISEQRPEFAFHAVFDEIRVSSVARYDDDFEVPSEPFVTDASTLALFHCDEGSGTKLLDASGNDRHGNLVNPQWVDVEPFRRSIRSTIDHEPLANSLPWGWLDKPDQTSPPINCGPQINSDGKNENPAVSCEGRVLVFNRNVGKWQSLFESRREKTSEPFGTAIELPGSINLPNHHHDCPYLTPDGLTLWYSSNRPGTRGERDLWVTQRASLNDAWHEPENLGPNVNTNEFEQSPFVTDDGLTLLFSRRVLFNFCLFQSQRTTREEPFGPAQELPQVNEGVCSSFPRLTPDRLTLIFVHCPASNQMLRISYATRSAVDREFGSPWNLSPVINDAEVSGPSLAADGRSLYFASLRGKDLPNSDLWYVKPRGGGSDSE